MDKHTEAISKAEAKHVEMIARLTKARDDLATNEARRHGLALAFEDGDADARREVASLAKAAANLEESIKHSLTHAVEQAAQRVTAARLDADAEAKRQAAVKVRAAIERTEADVKKLVTGICQSREGYAGFLAGLREITMSGAPAPSANLIDVNSRRTFDAAMDGIHSKTRPVRPSQRHEFDELCEGG